MRDSLGAQIEPESYKTFTVWNDEQVQEGEELVLDVNNMETSKYGEIFRACDLYKYLKAEYSKEMLEEIIENMIDTNELIIREFDKYNY